MSDPMDNLFSLRTELSSKLKLKINKFEDINALRKEMEGDYLFRCLIKDGCLRRGDMVSKKWRECLIIPEGLERQVTSTLEAFEEGTIYKRDGMAVWII